MTGKRTDEVTQQGLVVTWQEVYVEDNAGAGALQISSSHTNGDNFPIGTHTVTYTIQDGDGNQPSTSCSFSVAVNVEGNE